MALKKTNDVKEPTAAELEAQRVAEAAAADQKKLDDEAALAEQEKANKEAAERAEADAAAQKKLDDEAAAQESADKETERLAREKEQSDRDAASERERIAQEAAVAEAAGKTPRELSLVLVESQTFSDLRQPSTNKWITGKGQEHLLHDGWLTNQINSGLMKIVEE